MNNKDSPDWWRKNESKNEAQEQILKEFNDYDKEGGSYRCTADNSCQFMSFPGGPIAAELQDPKIRDALQKIVEHHPNNIGVHTNLIMNSEKKSEKSAEAGFEKSQIWEQQSLGWLAIRFGASKNNPLSDVEGYFETAGTGANIMGCWIGREFLKRKAPNPARAGIVCITSFLSHYSMFKGWDLTGLAKEHYASCEINKKKHLHGLVTPEGHRLCFVGTNDYGEMLVEQMAEKVRKYYHLGHRRFFIMATAGTTIYGSIDPIDKISDAISNLKEELSDTDDPVAFYFHVDASFGGMTIPFALPNLPIGFQNPAVHSIAVDPDKMGQLPYGVGIFLCRRSADLFNLVEHKIEYVGQGNDKTLLGSRPGWAPAMAYCLWRLRGVEGQKKIVQTCIELTNYLEEKLRRKIGNEKAVIMPRSENARLSVNVLPVAFPTISESVISGTFKAQVMSQKQIDEIEEEQERKAEQTKRDTWIKWETFLATYQLRFGFYRRKPQDPCSPNMYICKFLMMPRITKNHIDRFISDLKKLLEIF